MITIGIVLYNEEKNFHIIRENLRWMSAYTSKFNVLIVNNASTDNTLKKLIELNEEFSFKLINNHFNNLGVARQEVLIRAETEWVGFTDADCLISKRWVESLCRLKSIYEKTAHSAFGGPWTPAGTWKSDYEAFFINPLVAGVFPHLSQKNFQRRVAHIPTANVIYRRSDILAVGGFSSQFKYVGEDLDLSLRLKKAGKSMVMTSDLSIQHFLPENLKDWVKKIFNYGCGRVHVAFENKVFADKVLVFPILFLMFFWIAIINRFWIPIVFYACLTLLSSIVYKRKSFIPRLFFLICMTHFSYALGMLYKWIEILYRVLKQPRKCDLPVQTIEVLVEK